MKQITNVIKGHLTPTNKRHIKYMLSHNTMSGTISGITYYIENEQSTQYKVKVIKKDNSIILGEPFRIETAYFNYK